MSGIGAEEGQNGLSWSRQGGKEASQLCYSPGERCAAVSQGGKEANQLCSVPREGVLVFPGWSRFVRHN